MTTQRFIIEIRDDEDFDTLEDLAVFIEEALEVNLPDGVHYQLLELEEELDALALLSKLKN
jgi:hypothetical protein